MALIVNNIRSLFFDAVTGAPRATIDDAALQAFIAACDVNVGHPDANALAAAQAMLPVGGGPLAAPAPVSAGLLTALAAHAVTVGDVLAVIAGRTGVVGDLNAIANHVNHNAASDAAVVRNVATQGADLATIAVRGIAADLNIIANHVNNNAASDAAVVRNVATLGADLATIAVRGIPADLNIIANHANHNAASDAAVVRNVATQGTDLATIAVRGIAADLNIIANHVNHNEASDLAVIRNPNTPEATIDIIAARLPAEHMGHIVNNPNTRPALRHQIRQELVDALNDEVAPAPVGILTHFRASIGRLAAEHQSALVPHVYKLGDRGVAVNMHSEARTAIGKLVYK
jgi:hypothetical protein